jgi:hypothetical protein
VLDERGLFQGQVLLTVLDCPFVAPSVAQNCT